MKLINSGFDNNSTYFEHNRDSSGIPNIFIHGVGLDNSMWLPQKEYFKNKEIISAYKQAMAPIKANYTDEDISSFPTQEAEAKAWDADNTAETPLLDYMLANRPTVDKATLVSRILQNAVVYKQIAGPAIGKKQYLEDQLYALKAQHEDPDQPDVTQADIDAIVVDFSTS